MSDKCNILRHGIQSQKGNIPLLSDAHGALSGCTITALNSPPSFVSTPACMAARHTDEDEAYALKGRVDAHELEGSATPYTAAESSEQPAHMNENLRSVVINVCRI